MATINHFPVFMRGAGATVSPPTSPGLIIEDGTGVSDANTYVDVPWADAYFAARGKTAWAGTDAAKAAAIINAMDYVESKLRCAKGRKEFPGVQALAFPRLGVTDCECNEVTGIPGDLKSAVAEYALRALSGDLFPDPVASGAATTGLTLERKKVGPLEIETRYGSTTATFAGASPSYPTADRLLDQYIGGGCGCDGGGGGFGRAYR